jgi:hypothetical protein
MRRPLWQEIIRSNRADGAARRPYQLRIRAEVLSVSADREKVSLNRRSGGFRLLRIESPNRSG